MYDNHAEETRGLDSELSSNDSVWRQEDGAVQDEGTAPSWNGGAFENIARWAVYISIFFVPLWFLPFTIDSREFNKQMLLVLTASVGLVAYLVNVIKSGLVKYRSSSFYLPIVGLVIANLASVIFSVNRTSSLFGVGEARADSLVTWISLSVIFFLAINTIEDRGKIMRKIVVASLVLTFLFGVLQILGIHLFWGTSFANRAFNSVGSLNMLGFLAAISLALFTSQGTRDGGYLKFLPYVGLALALFLIALINWWPIWTVAFTSLIASVALASASDASLVKLGKMRLFVLPMTLIVVGMFLMLVNFNLTYIKSKLPIEIAPSHKASWTIAFNSLKSRPMGFGAENFMVAYDKFKPTSVVNSIFYQVKFGDSTSEAANMVVEGGVLTILGVLALLWFYGRELLGNIKNGFYGNKEASAIWASSFAVLVAYFLYPFNVTLLFSLFIFIALGVLSTSQQEDKIINLESDAKYSFAGSLGFIVGLVVVMVAVYFSINNYVANIYLAKASGTSDRVKMIDYYATSANTNPKDARTYRLLSQAIVAQLADELKKGPNKDETQDSYNSRVQNQIASAVNVALRATVVGPADSQNWANRGFIYENLMNLVGGADQAAINTYNESLSRNPADPNTYLRIGNVHLAVADNAQKALSRGQAGANAASLRTQIDEQLNKAAENYNKAITLHNNFGQALYNLAVVYDRQNKLTEAIKQFEKLRAANPRDPSFAFQIGLLYYRDNRKDNALEAWRQAVLLFPNYSNARWYLSLVYEERGDLAAALNQVEEIEKFNSENELVKQRLVQLRSGQRTIPPGNVLDKQPLNQ